LRQLSEDFVCIDEDRRDLIARQFWYALANPYSVAAPAGIAAPKSEDQPHALAYAPGDSLHGTIKAEREAVPVAGCCRI
jgi:hypothetical protein